MSIRFRLEAPVYMKLLTQEEAKEKLKPGSVVRVYWFTPRAPKGERVPSRQFDGRQEWVSEVNENRIVDCYPYESTSDGLVVQLRGYMGIYRVDRLELIS